MKKLICIIIIIVLIIILTLIFLLPKKKEEKLENLNLSSTIIMYVKNIGDSNYKRIYEIPKTGNYIITSSCNNMTVEWDNENYKLKNKIKSFPSSCEVKFEEK